MAEASNQFILKVKSEMEEFAEMRSYLWQSSGARRKVKLVFSGARDGAKSFVKKLGSFLQERDDADIQPLVKEKEFMMACNIVLTKLRDMKRSYDCHLFREVEYREIIAQIKQKQILISFFGDSNVGKSTLMNAIIGNWYLPIKHEAETGVTVHIEFSKSKNQEMLPNEELQKASENVVLSECVSGGVHELRAKGPTDIRKFLEGVNKASRSSKPEKSEKSNYVLHLNHPFQNDTRIDGHKVIFVDSPGCDEYGSAMVDEVVKKCRATSTAFIFVTSVDCYRRLESSKILKEMYEKNPGIIKDKRLTIIVNKMDSAVIPRFGSTCISTKELVQNVRKYLCEKVFHCSEEDLPEDSIIPTCGNWAFYGKNYLINPIPDLEQQVDVEFRNLIRKLEDEDDRKRKSESTTKMKAESLIRQSKILKIEERLLMMARCSLELWEKKMSSDIKHHLDAVKKNIDKEIESKLGVIEVLRMEAIKFARVLSNLKKFYAAIIEFHMMCENKSLHKQSKIWKPFSEAFDKDMEEEDNMESRLKEILSRQLEDFQNDVTKKISKGKYTPEDFENDLKKLLTKISEKINQVLSNAESCSNLYASYTSKTVEIHVRMADLGNRMSNALGQDKGELYKEVEISFPKLMAPILKIKTDIPLGTLNWFRQFLEMVKGFFKGTSVEESYSTEIDSDFFQVTESMAASGHETPTKQLNEQTVPSPKSDTSESKMEEVPSGSDPLSHEAASSSTSKASLPEGREKTVYRKWTPQLDAVMNKLKEEVLEIISSFFLKKDKTVIQVYVEAYGEEALALLKMFDTSDRDKIQYCLEHLEMYMNQMEMVYEELKIHKSYSDGITFMIKHFKKFCD